ncbi:endospore germination permease [Paenibacillus sp. GCM10027626]|uniref:GerAB/ArcD/ProY family transporter n=1 Tax=Paenibacillus sp. GCM10027626 TaxID=3273411 RepID=UPI00363CD411
MQQEKIGAHQFAILVILFCLGSSVLLVPAALAGHAKQDGWIAGIVGVLLGCAVIMLFNAYDKQIGQKGFVDACQFLLGKWIGTALAAVFVIHAFMLSVFMLRFIGDFMTTQIMPETPIEAILIMFVAIIVLAVAYGLETFSRTAEYIFPWLILLFLVLAGTVIAQIDLSNLQPVLFNGFAPVVRGSLVFVGIPYMELVLFLLILPSVDGMDKRKKAFIIAGLIGGLIVVAVTFLTLSVLGPLLTVRNVYPSFTLSKKINIGQFLKRIEALMAIFWFLAIFFKTTVTFYVTAKGLSQLLRLPKYQSVLIPIGIAAVVYAQIVYPDIVFGTRFANTAWMPYASLVAIFVPLILIIAAKIRKKATALKSSRAK